MQAEAEGGMSLRDYLAAHAPPMPEAWVTAYVDQRRHLWNGPATSHHLEASAAWSYRWADQALAERAIPAQSASDTAARLLLGEVLALKDRLPADLVERIRAVLR